MTKPDAGGTPSLTILTLVGLGAALLAGAALRNAPGSAASSALPFVEALGTLWTNALQMTVIPLVVSTIIAGIASVPDARAVGRLTGLSIATFVALLVAAASSPHSRRRPSSGYSTATAPRPPLPRPRRRP